MWKADISLVPRQQWCCNRWIGVVSSFRLGQIVIFCVAVVLNIRFVLPGGGEILIDKKKTSLFLWVFLKSTLSVVNIIVTFHCPLFTWRKSICFSTIRVFVFLQYDHHSRSVHCICVYLIYSRNNWMHLAFIDWKVKKELIFSKLFIYSGKKESMFVFLLNLQTTVLHLMYALEVTGFEAGIQHMINTC